MCRPTKALDRAETCCRQSGHHDHFGRPRSRHWGRPSGRRRQSLDKVIIGGYDGERLALEYLAKCKGPFIATATQSTQKMGVLASNPRLPLRRARRSKTSDAQCRVTTCDNAPEFVKNHPGNLIAESTSAMTTRSQSRSVEIQKSYGPIKGSTVYDLDIYPGRSWRCLAKTVPGKSDPVEHYFRHRATLGGEMTWLGRAYAPADPRAALNDGGGHDPSGIETTSEALHRRECGSSVLPDEGGSDDAQGDGRPGRAAAFTGWVSISRRIASSRGFRPASSKLIEIAKALTLNARLLILDERQRARGRGEPASLPANRTAEGGGVGIIYISHRLEEIPPDRRPHRRMARRTPRCRSSRVATYRYARSSRPWSGAPSSACFRLFRRRRTK